MAAPNLQQQLQSALGSSYALERELGGGGMSRVFVATETSLGRKVVVKVLTPELAEGVSVERFKREIQLAAQLQQAHIVPLLAAGEASGLPYYTMPFVEGRSLRTRLLTGGPMPITEAIGVLRDVAKALAYAHERGVVHRDIKPDNVLLSGGSAVVTDFGVAKALSASKTQAPGGTLTQVGTSLGTPTYMAPEQAAADPNTDYRADLYAFGVMAYEMLAGRPPFHGRSPHKLLAAQMGERPEPIGDLRPDVPPLLAQLVMRCLEKEPDDRPQSAGDVVRVLETVTSGTAHPAMPVVLLGGRRRLWRSLAIWAASFVGVVIVARAAVISIGLPEWVVPGAIAVMALGLPAILLTALVQRGAHAALTRSALTPGGTPARHSTMTQLALKASPWMSWRRTMLGGVWAVSGFVVLVAGYMLLRAQGIGPAGSLLAQGVIKERDPIVVADVQVRGGADTALGPVVTEALRTALEQARSVTLLPSSTVAGTLQRMQRPPRTPLDVDLAREVAQRNGVKAVVAGTVTPLGPGFVVAARLVRADSGDELVSYRETADTPKELLGAIDQLGRRLRDKLGESLKSVRASPPLQQVTTPSLEALRKFTQGSAANDNGDYPQSASLLQQAVALDTGFALAYRKLSVALDNLGGRRTDANDALAHAYAHRDRLTDPERLLVLGTYYRSSFSRDLPKAQQAYETLLQLQPDEDVSMNNLGIVYTEERQFSRAIAQAERNVAGRPLPTSWFVLLRAQLAGGDTAGGARTISRSEAQYKGRDWADFMNVALDEAKGQFDSAAVHATRAGNSPDLALRWREISMNLAADMALLHGRLADGLASNAAERVSEASRSAAAPLAASLDSAFVAVWFRGDQTAGARMTDAALRRHPLDSIPPLDRPYPDLIRIYALAGQTERAKALLVDYGRAWPVQPAWQVSPERQTALGQIAVAERRYTDAIAAYRAADQGFCVTCVLPPLGYAYDLAGQPDSAIAMFERFNSTVAFGRWRVNAEYLAGMHKRLGELYQARGDRERAASHYAMFVHLWQRADAELQPQVEDVRRRLRLLEQTEKH